ncbi:Hypothetical_protein [Hexamita inflata]|uniref:Hypothetical_protein n=1 Tax=Hexamita inflata TaxID=28002 RepID=A0AA86QKW5_9EUKA|nr:Hypothetical protein HINF_LOCUS49071 [Hexamita inflata]
MSVRKQTSAIPHKRPLLRNLSFPTNLQQISNLSLNNIPKLENESFRMQIVNFSSLPVSQNNSESTESNKFKIDLIAQKLNSTINELKYLKDKMVTYDEIVHSQQSRVEQMIVFNRKICVSHTRLQMIREKELNDAKQKVERKRNIFQ